MQTRLICAAFLPDTEQTLADKTAEPDELTPTNFKYSSSNGVFKTPAVNNN